MVTLCVEGSPAVCVCVATFVLFTKCVSVYQCIISVCFDPCERWLVIAMVQWVLSGYPVSISHSR